MSKVNLELTDEEFAELRRLEEQGQNAQYPEFTVFWDYSYNPNKSVQELEKGHEGVNFKSFDEAVTFFAGLKCKRKMINMYVSWSAPVVHLAKTEDCINWCKELKY